MNLFTIHFFSPKYALLRVRSSGGHCSHRSLFVLLLFAVHSKRGIIDFLSSAPSFVKEYSTRGGISAKASRLIKPSAWRFFSVSDRVFGLMPLNVSTSLLNLNFPQLPNALMMRSDHFLLIRSMMPFSGQMQVCSSFSHMMIAFVEDSDCVTINWIV